MGVKQVLVVRKDLNMRQGKAAAQAAHASMQFIVANLAKTGRIGFNKSDSYTQEEMSVYLSPVKQHWLDGNFRKIVARVESEAEFLALADKAREAGLEVHCIQDTGLTEFHGVQTWTALAIGPDTDERIDPVTSHLKLL